MVMNPRTHPRGAAPDFTLPKPNPNPSVMTDALWWLVCMREALEPSSQNGGTFANKPGSHNIGNNLPDFGQGNSRTDHSIRQAFNRTGSWWRTKCAAHDWTFPDAQRGDYTTIKKYTNRLINSMKSLTDLRPDDVYFYTLGQIDNDRQVEGWNEFTDDDETGDSSHLWHRHDSFRRNIIGSFPHMWKALTIDMGWTYAEWQRSVSPKSAPSKEEELPVKQADFTALFKGALQDKAVRDLVGRSVLEAKINDKANPARTVGDTARDFAKVRGVLIGDVKDTVNAALSPTSPLASVLGLPKRITEIESKISKLQPPTPPV